MTTTDARRRAGAEPAVRGPVAGGPVPPTAGDRTDRSFTVAVHLLLAVLAYGSTLAAGRGRVGADTKSYLYLDAGRLLERASSLWDPSVGAGTVSHQLIGYLWPMGPYFWLTDRLGLPVWVAQRLWLGTILFAAGAGVLYLLRTIGLRGAGAAVAALVYMLSPYTLAYAARISAILLPWAGLPWMVALIVRALRRGGWRHPALFALVVTTVGTINATSLLYAGIAVLCWVPFAVWGTREVTGRAALATVARVGGLTLLCQLWWLAALVVGGRYGLPVLEATETVEAVAVSSTATEVVRGLGNWFFYGNDKLGPWVDASVPYTQSAWLMSVSFAVPLLAVAAAVVVRWRHRGYFVLLVVTGVIIAVGAYPYHDPSPWGRALKAFADASTVGLALRNAPRAVPLVALGTACLLGAGVAALRRRLPAAGLAAAAVGGILAVANLPTVWEGTWVDPNTSRPEDLPEYWQEAAAHLDARDDGTRVLELPGADFASYRWGNTIDPITPGLIDRPYVARESLPLGSIPSANLLGALDRRLQEGLFEPASLAPIARLLAAGDVVLRSDLQYERYRTARPRPTWALLQPPPPGLGDPAEFGPPDPNVPPGRFQLVDEIALAVPASAPHPPPVAVFPVDDPQPIVRAEAATAPLVVAGDGEGLVDAAAAGLLDGRRLVRYSASMAADEVEAAVGDGAVLIVTDSNRRRAQRFTTVRETYGYTEEAGERALVDDPADARFDLFPGAGDAARTVAVHRGVARVQASQYGNIITYTPEDRAVLAVDGDPGTAWRVGAFSDPAGERLLVELEGPVTTDRVTITQPLHGPRNRWITRARLRFDGADTVPVELGDASRSPAGQEITFPRRSFTTIEVLIDDTNTGRLPRYDGLSPVGIAELRVGDVAADEVLRLPTDLLDKAGPAAVDRPLAVVVSRARSNPAEPFRFDEERHLARELRLPAGRSFAVRGTARLSGVADDAVLDRLLGVGGGVVARSSGRLPGDVTARASATLDGDPTTFWRPGLLDQEGNWLAYDLPAAVTLDRLDLVVIADGRHSVPTRLRLEGDGGQSRVVDVPAVTDRDGENATVAAPVRFPALTTRRLQVTVEAVRPVETLDYYSEAPVTLPVGVAEVGIPGVAVTPAAGDLPPTCHEGLLTAGGQPVGIRLRGSTAAAAARRGIPVEACGPAAAGVDLGAGEHEVRSAAGADTGIDVDRVVLESAAGGGAGAVADGTPPAGTPPRVRVVDDDRSSLRVAVDGATEPFWLVLGQSWNEGWKASAGDRDLGPPRLVGGMSNGWLVDPADLPDGDPVVSLRWESQRTIGLALALSAAGVLLCLVILGASAFRRRRTAPVPDGTVPPPRLASPLVTGGRPPGPIGVAGASLAVLGVAGMAIGPVPGLAVAALTAAALLWSPARALVVAGAVGGIGLAAAYTVAKQQRYDLPMTFSWAQHFHDVHVVAFVGVALLGVDALVERLRHS